MSIDHKVDDTTPPGSVKHFFSWWVHELTVFFSQLKLNQPVWKTLLFKSTRGMDIYCRSQGEIKHIAAFHDGDDAQQIIQQHRALESHDLSMRNAVLRISPDLTLNRKLTLPAAISDVIEPVLENKLEQIVPWPSNQSCFGYSLSDSQAPEGMVVAHLAVIRKQTVEAARHQASSLGFELMRADISDDIERQEGIKLHKFMVGDAKRLTDNMHKFLGTLFAILLFIGIVGFGRMAFIQTSLEKAEKRLAIATANNSLIGQARLTNLELVRQRDWLINQRKEQQSVAVIMESLTRILPDGTQLTRFEMNDKIIVIGGRTDNAAELIDKLELSSNFKDVKFYSPTLRKPNDVKEIFSIELKIASVLNGREKT